MTKNLEEYSQNPPILVNSLPKSGTHLLLQITRSLPSSQYLGRFIATSPSISQIERSPAQLARKVKRILPGETLGSHLFFSKEVESALEAIQAIHLFIYRDPRDVIASEAFYLAKMNRWHRMHKYFAKCANEKERLDLALKGLDSRYPDCNARLLPYAGWLSSNSALCIRYEDIAGAHQTREIERISEELKKKQVKLGDIKNLVSTMAAAVQPEKSHTFRRGGTGKWRNGIDEAFAKKVNQILRPSLEAFGY